MKKFTFLFALLMASAALVQAQLTFSGEFRPRAEYRHGFQTLADSAMDAAFFIDQRSRLKVDYKTESYRFKLSLQDIRTWGSVAQLNRVDGFTSVHEAWGEVFIKPGFSFKAGRQEIILDDHRIMGNVEWAQQARSHDAALLKYEKNDLKIHLAGAFNQNRPRLSTTNYTLANYKAMQFLWLHKNVSENLAFSILALNNGIQVDETDSLGNINFQTNYTQTVGAHVEGKAGAFALGFNGFYQMGATAEVDSRSTSAFLLGLDASYKLSDNIKASLGAEIQSGNSQTDTTANYSDSQHAFTPFYGTNHKFNGYMDYFYVGNHIGSVGLLDLYAKLKYTKEKKYLGLDFHLFSSAADVLDQKALATDGELKAMPSTLGMEIDLSAGGPLAKGVMLKGGYSQMFGTETLASLRGVYDSMGNPYNRAFNNWAYVMVIIKPTFFQSEKKP